MRVLFWVPAYPRVSDPSPFSFVETRVRCYAQAGVEVAVQALGSRGEGHQGQIRVFEDPPSRWNERIAGWRPDVVAIHYPIPVMGAALGELQVPAVVWLHGQEALWSFRYERQRSRFADLVKRVRTVPRVVRQILWLRRQLGRRADAVVTVSRWLKTRVVSNLGLSPERVRVIPNPIDTDRFCPVRRGRGVNGGVSMRSLSKRVYGFDLAIKALAGVPSSRAHLTIIGDGAELERYCQLARRMRSPVEFDPRWVPNAALPNVFAGFGIYSNTAHRETHGVTMCEAMATGMPVVAQSVAAIPEYVRDGEDGYLVAPHDLLAFRDRFIELAGDPDRRRRMGEAATEHVRHKCSARLVAESELSVLQNASEGSYKEDV